MNFLKSKPRLLLLSLVGMPCLLLGLSLKVARDRPHLFATRKLEVGLYFPEDNKSVCLSDENTTQCYNKSTHNQEPNGDVGVLQHRGPFYFEKMDDNSISYEIRDGKAKSDPYWRSRSVKAVFSSDKRFVTLANRNEVKCWDFQQARFLWQSHFQPAPTSFPPAPTDSSDYVDVDALSPDGVLCVVVRNDDDSSINWIIGDCRSGKVIAPIKYPKEHGKHFSFSPDGRTLCVITDDAAYFLDSHTDRFLWKEKIPANSFIEPDYAPDGLVGMPRANGFDFLEARTGKLKLHLAAPSLAQIESWSFSHDGKQLWWSTPKHQVFWLDLK